MTKNYQLVIFVFFFFFIILTLITFALVMLGGIYPWLEVNQISIRPCTQDAKLCPDGSAVGRTGPNCEFAACQEVKADETSNWQTYRNEKYGFELKYPNNWKFIKDEDSFIGPANYSSSFILPKNPADMSGTCKVSIGNFDNSSHLSLSDWLKQATEETGAPAPISSVPITINGVTGVKEVGEEVGLTTTVYLPKEDRILSFVLYGGDDVLSKCEINFNQILSTFKFIPSASSGQAK